VPRHYPKLIAEMQRCNIDGLPTPLDALALLRVPLKAPSHVRDADTECEREREREREREGERGRDALETGYK